MIKKLSKMPHAQAHVTVYDDGTIKLTSYVTDVAIIDKNGWLTVYGLYSNTTRKHISAFMDEYGCGADYYVAKRCYNNNEQYNIYSGEIRA